MKRSIPVLLGFVIVAFALSGCQTGGTAIESVVNGEVPVEGYFAEVERANQRAYEAEQFEYTKETVRAYNLDTGSFQYVAWDTVQRWNNDASRWEFRPR